MSAINDGGPAFPFQFIASPNSECCTGMTLRDWFAGQALVGVLSNHELLLVVDSKGGSDPTYNTASRYAFAIADAMIAAREKGAQ